MQLPLPALAHTVDGVILALNDAFTRAVGYTEDELPTAREWLLRARRIPPAEIDAALATIEARFRNGPPFRSCEVDVWTASGERRDWLFEGAPAGSLADGRGVFLSVATDLTVLRERERDQAFIGDLVERLAAAEDPRALREEAADALARHLAADRCLLCEVELGSLRVHHDTHGPRERPLPLAALVPDTVEALTAGRTVVNCDVAADPRTGPHLRERGAVPGLGAYIAVPVMRAGRWVAVLALGSTAPRAWTEREQRVAEMAAERIWLRYENVTLLRGMQEELRQREDLLRRLRVKDEQLAVVRELAPQILWSSDAEGRLLYVNRHGFRYTGITPAQAAHLRWTDVVPPEDREALEAAFRRARAAGEPFVVQGRLRRADGDYRWHENRGWPRRGEDGRITGWVGLLTDVHERRLAEEALRSSEARARARLDELENVYAAVPVGLCVVDRDGLLVRINEVAARMAGAAPEALLGRGLGEVAPALAGQRAALLARVLASGEPIADVELHADGPGRPRTWIEHWRPIRDAAGGVACVSILCEDVTERRRSEKSLATLAEASRALTGSLNPQETLERLQALVVPSHADWSAAWIEADAAFGDGERRAWRHEDSGQAAAVERLVRECSPLAEASRPLREALLSGRPRLYSNIRDADVQLCAGHCGDAVAWDALSPASLMALPLRARGRTFGLLVLAFSREDYGYDEQDLAWAEDLVSRAALALDNARLYRKAQRAAESLMSAARRKDEFLAMLGHELRNPLAPIRNAAEYLRLTLPREEPVRRAADMIARQSAHLARLVDDLLDMSRIVHGKIALHKELIELDQLVYQAVDSVRPLLDERDHRLILELPPQPLRLLADPTRLCQVIANLLHNAIKYTDPGGRIVLSAWEEDGGINTAVEDNGRGIAADLLPRVFDLFTQEDGVDERAQGGLGIGLSLVKRLVLLHGGTVSAESGGPGRGSRFMLRMPAAEAAAARPQPRLPADRPTGGAMRVLVVDDNGDAAESLALLLRLQGRDVRVACTGAEALLVARAFVPDVAVLDIGLPDMDGYALARGLREQRPDGMPRLLALSGRAERADFERSLAQGFERHLVKPVEPGDLLAALDPPGTPPQ